MKKTRTIVAFLMTVIMGLSGISLDGFAAFSYAAEDQGTPAVTQEQDVEEIDAAQLDETEVDAAEEEPAATAETDSDRDDSAAPDEVGLVYQTLKAGKVKLEGLMPEEAKAIATDASDMKAVKRLESKDDNALAAYDITIQADGAEYQPDEENPILVQISNKAIKEDSVLEIWHLKDDGTKEQVNDFETRKGSVYFEADGFSVYVIIEHEGGEVVTPRVEFHFIAPQETISSTTVDDIAYYTSTKYEFENKASDKQTTMIVHDGDTLESIETPPNMPSSSFFGWYTVDYKSDSGNSITYSWPDDTERVELDHSASVEAEKNNGAITSIHWSVGDASGTVTADSGLIDEEGCAHVYLAPIYDNYHFVNFHIGARGKENAANIMTRKLVVLGNSSKKDVLVSDIEAPSTDPVHLIFVGWEYQRADTGDWEIIRTVDDEGNPIEKSIEFGSNEVGSATVDLYPEFVQARWLKFNVGESGNDAVYVAPKFMYTSDHNGYPVDSLDVSSRVGYTFQGWFTEAEGQGTKIANSDGSIVQGPVEKYDGSNLQYKIENGKLYVYEAMEDLTLYAYWTPDNSSSYYIYFWKQNPNDDGYSLADYDIVTNAAAGTMTQVNGSTRVSPEIDTSLGTKSVSELFTSEHFALNTTTHPIENKTIHGNGSTIVNVYYDREYYTLKFYFARQYTYNGRAYIQVNNNNERFNNTAYTNANSLITALTTNGYDDYSRDGGTNTWRDIASNSLTSAQQLVKEGYLAGAQAILGAENASIETQAISTNTTVFTGTTGTLANNNSARRQGDITYFYIQLKVKYGQSLAGLWPDAGQFNFPQRTTGYNANGGGGSSTTNSPDLYGDSRNQSVNPLLWGSMGKGNATEKAVADESLIQNVADNEGYYILYTRFESTKSSLFRVYFSALDGETKDETYNGVDYVEQDGDPATTQSLTCIKVSGYGDFNDVIAPSYEGFSLVNGNASGKVAGSSSSGTYNGTNYTWLFKAYYKRNEHSIIFNTNVEESDTVKTGDTVHNMHGPQTATATAPYGEKIRSLVGNVPGTYTKGETTRVTSDGTTYIFQGWYDNPACTGADIDFASLTDTMPDKDITYYASWEKIRYRVSIDANGGVIDHINYNTYGDMLTATGLSGSYDTSAATYFNTVSNEQIGEYTLHRPYVRISDAEAATMAEGSVFRYVNMQYIDDYGSYTPDARNAVYIYDTQESIDAYYNYYKQVIQDTGEGTVLPKALWESTYLSTEKYRRLRAGENYECVGWYEVLPNGNLASSPYDFSTPATHATSLRAMWRLDGGYTLHYTTEYDTPTGEHLTGTPVEWIDPADGTSKYSDQAKTQAMQGPSHIKADGVATDEYQFRGWRIVKIDNTSGGRKIYTPLEPGVYYTAGQAMTVQAMYSNADMNIFMQAVYEKRTEAYHRPDVINLTLDASKDAGNVGEGYVDTSAGSLPEWKYPGISSFSDDTKTVDGSNEKYKILFGDAQSNTAVHLYKYATTLTEDEVNGDSLDPVGINYFKHSKDFNLLGFDQEPDTDYVADYAADSVIAVTPGDSKTLYAVWEPLVYLTFVNDTDVGDVTFNLGGTGDAMRIVNRVDGSFTRVPIDTSQSITVRRNETVTFAVPYGAGETITVNGTNTLGTGYMLSAKSELGTTDPQARSLTGTITGTDADYKLVPNNEGFGFSDSLVTHSEGVVITFEAEKAPHTLVLNDNYEGGNTVEVYFSETGSGTVYYGSPSTTSYELPSTGTRIGYEFLGWDENPAATTPTFSNSEGWTIDNLTRFFNGEEEKTLYAIWTSNAKRGQVEVWKEIDGPGDQNQEFTFTLSLGATFSYQYRSGQWGRWSTYNNQSISTNNGSVTNFPTKAFTISHGERLLITSSKSNTAGTNPFIQVSVQKLDKNGLEVGAPVEIKWTWNYINSSSSANTGYKNFQWSAQTPIAIAESDYSSIGYGTTEEVINKYSTYDLTPNSSDRSINWDNTDAGGTVVFTNTRKTADVTIKKTLFPSTLEARTFPFEAKFMNGTTETDTYEGYTLDPTSKNVTSGSDGWTISGIPTGATLKITEDVDSDTYTTSASASSGGSITDLNNADNVFQFAVSENTTVNFKNELKTQKVRIVVKDAPNGNTLDSAVFTFPGVFEGEKYSATGTGIVGGTDYTAYAGDYTLTEVSMPNHRYQKLERPVLVSVKGSGVSVPEGTDNVSVAQDSSGVWVITVINPKLTVVKVKKTVTADGGSAPTTSFLFTAILRDSSDNPVQRSDVINPGRINAQGTDSNGKVTFTLVNNQEIELYIPKNTKLTVTESANSDYETSYQQGTSASDLGASTQGVTATIDPVTLDDYLILFTNKYAVIVAPTGYVSRQMPYICMALLALMLLAVMVMGRRRRSWAADGMEADAFEETDTAEPGEKIQITFEDFDWDHIKIIK